MYTFHDVFVPYVHLPGPMSSDHMYTYQDLCPRIIHILTGTYVLGSQIYIYIYKYLPGPMSLDYMYTCQDLHPWIICIPTRTYVLGSYVCLPGLMSLDHMYTYQDLCPWIICKLTRAYVLGSYIYLPGPRSLEKATDKQSQDRLIHREKITGISMYKQVETEVYRCWNDAGYRNR